MKRTKQLTLEQHFAAGKQLLVFRNGYIHLLHQIGHAYPKGAKVTRLAWKLYNALDDLRCELDDRVCTEQPAFKEATTIYYGPSQLDTK